MNISWAPPTAKPRKISDRQFAQLNRLTKVYQATNPGRWPATGEISPANDGINLAHIIFDRGLSTELMVFVDASRYDKRGRCEQAIHRRIVRAYLTGKITQDEFLKLTNAPEERA